MAKRGGFPGGMPGNMNNLMKQAQRMQRQMEEKQKELEEKQYSASAGGGAVTVTVSVRSPYLIAINAVITLVILAGYNRSKAFLLYITCPSVISNKPAASDVVSEGEYWLSSVTTHRLLANKDAYPSVESVSSTGKLRSVNEYGRSRASSFFPQLHNRKPAVRQQAILYIVFFFILTPICTSHATPDHRALTP